MTKLKPVLVSLHPAEVSLSKKLAPFCSGKAVPDPVLLSVNGKVEVEMQGLI